MQENRRQYNCMIAIVVLCLFAILMRDKSVHDEYLDPLIPKRDSLAHKNSQKIRAREQSK